MNKSFYILFFLTLSFTQNFSYSEEDWFVITSPKEITSITNTQDEILFSSTNGIFTYNQYSNEFYFKHKLISEYINDKILLVHYDQYRDHIWVLTDKGILFKSYISNIWRDINFYDIGLSSYNSIYNIGSNQDYIIIESNSQYLLLDPYNGNVIENPELLNTIQFDQINWSSSYRSYLNNKIDLTNYFTLNEWYVVNAKQIEKKGRRINITCSLNDERGKLWLGTDSGEIFYIDLNSKLINKLKSVPPHNNIKYALLDMYDEWWIADNGWLYSDDKYVYEQEVKFLCRWNENENLWTIYFQNEYPKIESKDITSIFRINESVYVGTMYGLLILDLIDNDWTFFNDANGGLADYVKDIVFYDNNLYLGTDKGIYTFSTIINKPIPNELYYLNCNIHSIDIKENYLFVASEYGLYKINLNNNESIKISDRVFDKIYTYKDYILLLIDNNIIKYENKSFNKLRKFDNIINLDVCMDNIWMHNQKKAAIFNINSRDYTEYNYLDGILGSSINNIGCDEAWVWFLTNSGISFYNWSNYHYENK